MGLTYALRTFSPAPTSRTHLVADTAPAALTTRVATDPRDGRFTIRLLYVVGSERVVVVGEVPEVISEQEDVE